MERICWSIEGLYKGDAQKCYDECQTLDEITPESVLEKAKNRKTELHKCFEWDDSVAGEKYRLIQARQIIQHFMIVSPETDDSFVKVRSYQISTTRNVYLPSRVIVQQPDEYKALLKRAKAELEAFKQRYKTLAELESLFEVIDEVLVV